MTDFNTIPLSELIETLRGELMVARALGQGKDVRFDVELAEMEVQVVARREFEGEGKGKIKLLILEAEAGGGFKYGKEMVQKITLKLRPKDGPTGGTLETVG